MRFLEAGRGNFWLFEAWGRKIPCAAFSGALRSLFKIRILPYLSWCLKPKALVLELGVSSTAVQRCQAPPAPAPGRGAMVKAGQPGAPTQAAHEYIWGGDK